MIWLLVYLFVLSIFCPKGDKKNPKCRFKDIINISMNVKSQEIREVLYTKQGPF